MGAGSITSNVKSDKKLITIKGPDGNIDTGIKRLVLSLGIMLRLAAEVCLILEQLLEERAISILFQV